MKKNTFTMGLIAIILVGGGIVYTHHHAKPAHLAVDDLLAQADNSLNIGRYNAAKEPFESILKLDPQNQQAIWGLRIVHVSSVSNPSAFKLTLDGLHKEQPNDSYINLLLGEFYAANNEVDKAQSYFEEAIDRNKELAEAHFDLAVLYEQQGQLDAAKNEYILAIDIESIPKYHSHLAHLYIKKRLFDFAITEYEKNSEYPLSALENAKIYWQHDQLDIALIRQLQAINWLNDKAVMDKADNQDAWVFKLSPEKTIELKTLDKKKAYAFFSVAITLYLLDNPEEAGRYIKKIRELNLPLHADIDTLINADLDTFVQEQNSYATQIEAFRKQYL